MKVLHVLKIDEKYCARVISGKKTAELRRNDRDFKVGDNIMFVRIKSTGDDLIPKLFVITDITDDFMALHDGYVMLSIRSVSD